MVKSINRILVAFLLLGSSLLSIVLAGPASAAPAAPAASSSGDSSWTVRTALSGYGSNRNGFGYTVNAGREVLDGIVIANQGSHPITLDVYAADGFTTSAGGFDILGSDKKSKDVGAWVKPAQDKITVPAKTEVQVPFRVTVPANATPGDHMGGIVTVLDQKSDTQAGTVIHQRVGMRIKLRVSGELTPRLEAGDLGLAFDGGTNPFRTGTFKATYTVRNTGNVVLGGLQTLKVSGGLGGTSRTLTLDRLPELLPGESWTTTVPVPKVDARLWVSGHLTLTPVSTDAAGSTATLDPVTLSGRVFLSVWSWVILIGGALLLVVLVLAVFVGVRRWRRRSSVRAEAKIDAAVEAKLAAAVEDALHKSDR